MAAQQSNPALLLNRGLPVDAGSTTVGVGRYRTGPGAMQHGALKVAQDRGPDSYHGTQNLGVAVDRLSLSGAIPPGAPAVTTHRSALLKGETNWVARQVGGVVCLALSENRNPRGEDREQAPPGKVRTMISGC